SPAPEIAELAAAAATGYAAKLDVLDFTASLEQAWTLVRALNRFVEERAPWQLAKQESDEAQARLDETLYTLADGVRLSAVLLANVLPVTAPRILGAVGEAGDAIGWERAVPGLLAGGSVVDASSGPLFPRIERPLVAA